jgi:putative RNA 2'-phosphotransferase
MSRFLAFVLRHHPEEAGLELDDRGSVDLDAMVEGMRARPGFEAITRDKIEHLAATDEGAARFEIQDNRIRARYGHSLAQAIQHEPADPPADLFHGTTPDSAEQILAEGLKPGDRQRVHLSVDTPAAREVGGRRCTDPVILRIDTAGAAKAGVRFYPAAPTVWLSDDIPPQCIFRAE